MIIAILTQQYGLTWSGVGTYSFELAQALADRKMALPELVGRAHGAGKLKL